MANFMEPLRRVEYSPMKPSRPTSVQDATKTFPLGQDTLLQFLKMPQIFAAIGITLVGNDALRSAVS
jgi:hypothetical protein